MAREGLVRHPNAARHCIVPHQRVRDLLGGLGCDGLDGLRFDAPRQMAAFLEKHGLADWTLERGFDLPLNEVAGSESLQLEFFGQVLVTRGAQP